MTFPEFRSFFERELDEYTPDGMEFSYFLANVELQAGNSISLTNQQRDALQLIYNDVAILSAFRKNLRKPLTGGEN